jgi:hypothetical protein
VIRLVAVATGLSSAPLAAWGTTTDRVPEGLVPVADGTKPFPLFRSDEGPW